MRILIVRHGDPDYVNDTLTEKGHREAKLLAEKLQKEKIEYFYSSPLGRAKDTCAYTAKAMGREKDVKVLDWLKEFCVSFTLPNGVERPIFWDMLPEFWTTQTDMYDRENWKNFDFFRNSDIEKEYKYVTESLDALLAEHGYQRDGNLYRTEKGNTDTLVFFCHFGLESVLLSHLLNVSPIVMAHHFVAPPTSVTTLYSEERHEGIVTFRCSGFGDVGHLYAGGETPSTSARFCEIYHSNDRHD